MVTKMLYEENLDGVLSSKNWKRTKKEEKKRTTAHLPQWLRISLSELKEIYRISWSEITERIIAHGFSIIQHEYNEEITAIEKYRKKLRFTKVETIRNFFTDFSVNIDGLEKPMNKHITIDMNIYSAIGETGEKLGIDFSSMTRLCFYHSLVRTDKIPAEITINALTEVEKFDRILRERKLVMRKMSEADDEWEEK